MQVSKNINVSNNNDWAFVEPALAVSETSQKVQVIAAMGFNDDHPGARLKVFYTDDSGKSWTPSGINTQNLGGNDPWLASDLEGNFYLSCLPNKIYKSSNGGKSWQELSDWLYKYNDYPKLQIDKVSSQYKGRIYLWASRTETFDPGKRGGPLNLRWKTPNGDTFNSSERLFPNNFFNQVGNFAIHPSGSVILPFHEIDVYGEYIKNPRLWIVRSDDGGKTFTNPFLAHEYFIVDSPDMTVDASGGDHHGRVFLSYMDVIDLEKRIFNYFIMHSDDKGETWSEPVPITEEFTAGHPPHLARVKVNQNGLVGITLREPELPEKDYCNSLQFIFSKDGGQTMSQAFQVSEVSSCSNQSGNEISINDGDRPVYDRYGDGGDYHGLTTLNDGGFAVVWADSREGIYQLYYSQIRIDN